MKSPNIELIRESVLFASERILRGTVLDFCSYCTADHNIYTQVCQKCWGRDK